MHQSMKLDDTKETADVRRAIVAARAPAEWGDPHGPLVLGVAVVSFLATAWCAEVRAWLARA